MQSAQLHQVWTNALWNLLWQLCFAKSALIILLWELSSHKYALIHLLGTYNLKTTCIINTQNALDIYLWHISFVKNNLGISVLNKTRHRRSTNKLLCNIEFAEYALRNLLKQNKTKYVATSIQTHLLWSSSFNKFAQNHMLCRNCPATAALQHHLLRSRSATSALTNLLWIEKVFWTVCLVKSALRNLLWESCSCTAAWQLCYEKSSLQRLPWEICRNICSQTSVLRNQLRRICSGNKKRGLSC